MTRRPTEYAGDFPLFIIPYLILPWIRRSGEELEWILIRWSVHHCSRISIRTRPVKPEFGRAAPAAVEVTA